MAHDRGARGRPGFTLIELLVVMGIISLLIGLLMPALGWARQSSRKAACLSNLHQLGVTMHTYLGDNNGVLPYVLPYSMNEGDESLLTELDQYLTNNDVFICPADDTGVAEKFGSSYEYIGGLLMWAEEIFRGAPKESVARTISVSYERNPGKTPVMVDAEPWHKGIDELGQNGLFWDGSAEPLSDWEKPKGGP